jgi:hypothetical protein
MYFAAKAALDSRLAQKNTQAQVEGGTMVGHSSSQIVTITHAGGRDIVIAIHEAKAHCASCQCVSCLVGRLEPEAMTQFDG